MKFYGQSTNYGNYSLYERCLLIIQSNDFFGLTTDLKPFLHYPVPNNCFELLLDTMEMIGYNEQTMEIIVKNIPDDYNLERFPREFVIAISKINAKKSTRIIIGTKKINVWDLSTNLMTETHITCQQPIINIACGANNQIFIDSDKHFYRMDENNYPCVSPIKKIHDTINSCCTTDPNTKIISSNYYDIFIQNNIDDEILEIYNGTEVTFISCSSDNTKIVSGDVDGNICIWNIETGESIDYLWNDNNEIISVYFACTDTKIISATESSIQIWHETKIQKIINTDISIICMICSSNEIISSHDDFTIKIWDIQSGLLLKTLTDESTVIHLCYSPDNEQIISINRISQIKIWDRNTGDIVQEKSLDYYNKVTCMYCYYIETPLGKKLKHILDKKIEILTFSNIQ